VVVEDGPARALRVSAAYERALSGGAGETAEQTAAVREQVSRARGFLQHLQRRFRLLARMGQVVVSLQGELLEGGPAHLRPLQRAELARQLGVHLSTVSRATASKFVELPRGEVIAFRTFFDQSLPARRQLRQLTEGPGRRLSDAQLAQALEQVGLHLARRTVAKYRKQMGLPKWAHAAGGGRAAKAAEPLRGAAQ
jgi:RNA polymerase sigma-54 factor